METAIKLKLDVKQNNPDLFKDRNVGDIFSMSIPKAFKRVEKVTITETNRVEKTREVEQEVENEDGETVIEMVTETYWEDVTTTTTENLLRNKSRYDLLTDLHEADGFGEIIQPQFNPETHKKGELIPQGVNFTYKLIAYTDEEIAENEDRKIAKEVPKLYMKLQLLEYGIDDDDVVNAIETAKNLGHITEKQSKQFTYKWMQSNIIERKNNNITLILPILNQVKKQENHEWVDFTNDDIINIFKNYLGI